MFRVLSWALSIVFAPSLAPLTSQGVAANAAMVWYSYGDGNRWHNSLSQESGNLVIVSVDEVDKTTITDKIRIAGITAIDACVADFDETDTGSLIFSVHVKQLTDIREQFRMPGVKSTSAVGGSDRAGTGRMAGLYIRVSEKTRCQAVAAAINRIVSQSRHQKPG